MVIDADFNATVPLPPQLTVAAVRKSIEYVEKEATGLLDIYFEQANVFSAIIGILGTRALDAHSIYEKHRHADVAQQRFPDLCRRGSGQTPFPGECLESKGSKRPWAVQSHYDHEGWYIIWRYLVDPTELIEAGKNVIVWRVDVIYLTSDDWKYEKSTAGVSGGGRTHTFGVKNAAAKLKDNAVYARHDIRISGGKPTYTNGVSEK